MNKVQQDEIHRQLGTKSADTRIAEFYIKAVFDADRSTSEAKLKADAEAEAKAERTGRPVEADYSRDNLKRLGAKNKYKDVLYVLIRHRGDKDCKSRIANEEDKEVFKTAYDAFIERTERNYLSLELLPGIKPSILKELELNGIKSVEDLAKSDNEEYPEFKQLAQNLMRLNNGNIREERPNLQTGEIRQEHNTQSFGWSSPYTVTFGN